MKRVNGLAVLSNFEVETRSFAVAGITDKPDGIALVNLGASSLQRFKEMRAERIESAAVMKDHDIAESFDPPFIFDDAWHDRRHR